MTDCVNIAYACADNYAPVLGVSLYSLCKNNAGTNLHVYVLDYEISDENKERLRRTVQAYGKEIDFVPLKETLSFLSRHVGSYGSDGLEGFICYAYCFIAELLPEIRRMLYLDCDTLVTGDISGAYNFALDKDRFIGECPDAVRCEYKKVIGLPPEAVYYSSGCILLDLDGWRNHGASDILLREIKSGRQFPLCDQDLMVTSLYEHIQPMPVKYNYLSQYFLYSGKDAAFVLGLDYFARHAQEFDGGSGAAVLYHFCGNTFIRPWFRNSHHPLKALYDRYYYESEWKDVEQRSFKEKPEYAVQYLLFRYAPRPLFLLLSFLMQRFFMLLQYGK
ncbi:MAG: glycosyltransferase family 8 protein [Treponema sp.]|nr:glycosyltransferase family 8 protein [Treponema sp.]